MRRERRPGGPSKGVEAVGRRRVAGQLHRVRRRGRHRRLICVVKAKKRRVPNAGASPLPRRPCQLPPPPPLLRGRSRSPRIHPLPPLPSPASQTDRAGGSKRKPQRRRCRAGWPIVSRHYRCSGKHAPPLRRVVMSAALYAATEWGAKRVGAGAGPLFSNGRRPQISFEALAQFFTNEKKLRSSRSQGHIHTPEL